VYSPDHKTWRPFRVNDNIGEPSALQSPANTVYWISWLALPVPLNNTVKLKPGTPYHDA
jgi:hypothetical protein